MSAATPLRRADLHQLLQHAPSGLAKTVSPLDGIERWNAYRHFENSNLVVSAALSEAEELASWRHQALLQAMVVGAIILLILGCAAYLHREIAQRAEASAPPPQTPSVQAAGRVIRPMSSSRLGFDGIRRYVSPSAATCSATGRRRWSGASRRSSFHAEDRSLSETAWARLQQGAGDQILTYRLGHKNGGWIWVETTLSAVQNPDGGEPREMWR